jgi:hypothetical protein
MDSLVYSWSLPNSSIASSNSGTSIRGRERHQIQAGKLTQMLPADNGREVKIGVVLVDGSKDTALKIHGPSFIEPAV